MSKALSLNLPLAVVAGGLLYRQAREREQVDQRYGRRQPGGWAASMPAKGLILSPLEGTPDITLQEMWRRDWFESQFDLDSTRLVFIDETWAKMNMVRTHCRASRGERLPGL